MANYYLFKRNGINLLVLPKDKQTALKTLEAYLPQTFKAKIAYYILKFSIFFGIYRFILKKATAPFSNVINALILNFQDQYSNGLLGFLICNPDHGDRIICIKRNKKDFSIIKATDTIHIEELKKEYKNISKYSGIAAIPKTISEGFISKNNSTEEVYFFEMPYYKKTKLISLEDERIHKLLLEWRKHKITHGDFAPWNLREDSNGNLVAIDWEWAHELNDKNYDLLYAIRRVGTLVEKIPEKDINQYISNTINNSKWMKTFISSKE